MNIRSFAGSLILLSLIAVLMPLPALHSQSPSKALTSPAKPADSPIRFTYQPIDFKLDSDETPLAMLLKLWLEALPSSITTTTASWVEVSDVRRIARHGRLSAAMPLCSVTSTKPPFPVLR
jgi:hypothetical protein